jgi:hypothetical protein
MMEKVVAALISIAITGWWFYRPIKDQLFVNRMLKRANSVGMPRHVASRGNYKNPSHVVHEAIFQTFEEMGEDYRNLTQFERNFMRAYEFDSSILRGGLESFFDVVRSREAWSETVDALKDVAAHQWATIFRAMIRLDGEAIEQYFINENDDFIPLSMDWDQKFHDTRIGNDDLEKLEYMERLLDAYVNDFYPWALGVRK